MTDPQKQLLVLLSQSLLAKSSSVELSEELKEEAKNQTVYSLLCKDYQLLSQNIRVISSHASLSQLLAPIPHTMIKGYASAYYYPEPINRTMGDVDIFVDPSFFAAAEEILLKNGWKKHSTDHVRHVGFVKNKVNVEIHEEIKGIPNGKDGIETSSIVVEKRVRDYLSNLIESSHSVETQYGRITIPDDFHNCIIMLLHIAGHMFNDGGIGLRHLCDWAVFVAKVDVSSYRSELESIGLWTFACQITSVCSEYLGLPRQIWAGEWPKDFLCAVLEDILRAGNFGCKESGRRTTLAIHQKSFAAITRERYPRAKNILLLPFYMFVNCCRFVWLLIRGKKRIIRLSTIQNARNRDNLYKQFRIFEL